MEEHSELAQNIPKNGGKLSPEQDLNRRKCLALKRKCDGVDSVRTDETVLIIVYIAYKSRLNSLTLVLA